MLEHYVQASILQVAYPDRHSESVRYWDEYVRTTRQVLDKTRRTTTTSLLAVTFRFFSIDIESQTHNNPTK